MTSPPPAARRPGLDLLRAVAIVAVMLYHLTIFGELPASLLPVTWYGWMGVDLFFVLSGYLIGGQLLRPYSKGARPGLLAFYRRRAFRILPAYLVVLGLYFLVPPFREFPRLAPLWKFLTFTMNLGFSFEQRGFSNAWSLCVEEHFYLVLPLLVLLLMRRPSARKGWTAFACVLLWGVALRAWMVMHRPDAIWQDIYYPTWTRLDGLAAGVGLATLEHCRPAWWRRLMTRGHLLLGAGLVCVAAVLWLFRGRDFGSATGPALWGTIFGFPLLAAGLALLTASSMSRNGWLARAHVPGAQTLAALAYTLYLTHKAVAHLVMELLAGIGEAGGAVSWLAYAGSCVAVAWLLHAAVERPFLRLRDRRAQAQASAALEDEMRREPAL